MFNPSAEYYLRCKNLDEAVKGAKPILVLVRVLPKEDNVDTVDSELDSERTLSLRSRKVRLEAKSTSDGNKKCSLAQNVCATEVSSVRYKRKKSHAGNSVASLPCESKKVDRSGQAEAELILKLLRERKWESSERPHRVNKCKKLKVVDFNVLNCNASKSNASEQDSKKKARCYQSRCNDVFKKQSKRNTRCRNEGTAASTRNGKKSKAQFLSKETPVRHVSRANLRDKISNRCKIKQHQCTGINKAPSDSNQGKECITNSTRKSKGSRVTGTVQERNRIINENLIPQKDLQDRIVNNKSCNYHVVYSKGTPNKTVQDLSTNRTDYSSASEETIDLSNYHMPRLVINTDFSVRPSDIIPESATKCDKKERPVVRTQISKLKPSSKPKLLRGACSTEFSFAPGAPPTINRSTGTGALSKPRRNVVLPMITHKHNCCNNSENENEIVPIKIAAEVRKSNGKRTGAVADEARAPLIPSKRKPKETVQAIAPAPRVARPYRKYNKNNFLCGASPLPVKKKVAPEKMYTEKDNVLSNIHEAGVHGIFPATEKNMGNQGICNPDLVIIKEGFLPGNKYKYRIIQGYPAALRSGCCRYCKLHVSTSLELEDHMKKEHQFKCTQCFISFNDELEKESHFITMHMKKLHMCNCCNEMFPSQIRFNLHCKSHYHCRNLEIQERSIKNVLRKCLSIDYDDSEIPKHFQPKSNKLTKKYLGKLDIEVGTVVNHESSHLSKIKQLVQECVLKAPLFQKQIKEASQQCGVLKVTADLFQENSNYRFSVETPKAVAIVEPTIRLKAPAENEMSELTQNITIVVQPLPGMRYSCSQNLNLASLSAAEGLQTLSVQNSNKQPQAPFPSPEKIKNVLNFSDWVNLSSMEAASLQRLSAENLSKLCQAQFASPEKIGNLLPPVDFLDYINFVSEGSDSPTYSASTELWSADLDANAGLSTPSVIFLNSPSQTHTTGSGSTPQLWVPDQCASSSDTLDSDKLYDTEFDSMWNYYNETLT